MQKREHSNYLILYARCVGTRARIYSERRYTHRRRGAYNEQKPWRITCNATRLKCAAVTYTHGSFDLSFALIVCKNTRPRARIPCPAINAAVTAIYIRICFTLLNETLCQIKVPPEHKTKRHRKHIPNAVIKLHVYYLRNEIFVSPNFLRVKQKKKKMFHERSSLLLSAVSRFEKALR